ncbi:hypothetical protein BGZ96_010143 [Linnemannia gamsii]|uniref:Uncharacterized protein n=1 Tax=Linnemannia gamsii TaxID=64522 RepID=A0ABQ7JUY0_9FUNG|nr:hypothetical protein BGZ96_010143 [Linnemannia gamsii]
MYDDSEVEDLQAIEELNALVVDIPETMGWLQVFEHALSTFQTSFELELDSSDPTTIHPIKAWAGRDDDNNEKADHQTARTAPKRSSSSSTNHHCLSSFAMTPQSQSQSSILSPVERDRIRAVKRQMSASSLDALKRLQNQQQHYHLYHRQLSRQTQERFHYVVGDEEQVSSATTLLAAALSVLRRFRDHVNSNLMDPTMDEELESDLSRLGFAGD